MKLLSVLLLTLLLIGGCSSDDEEETATAESYRGELRVDFDPLTVGEKWVDTIVFSFNNGVYSITHVTDNGNPSSLCDSEGEIGGLNSNTVRLTPDRYFGGNCSQRGPSGEFAATFKGDSLILVNIDQSAAEFELRLERARPLSTTGNPLR
ncbi:hypothetical protein GF420_13080 [candidate division GN15 bacterium]|nr:hypothetical protein [candidate division GN15 bacterium]